MEVGQALGVDLSLPDRKGKGRKGRGETCPHRMSACLRVTSTCPCSYTEEVPRTNRPEGIAQHLS